ncbi:MAG: hypothetical protein HKM01_07595, partial [Gallionella sp.]|nr:hypothetical protein [Gallionella sp.]
GWGYGGWGWGDDWIAPALIGGVVAYDLSYPYGYAPSYGYVDVPVYTPAVTPTLIQPTVQYWYFCAASKTYYPYVSSCPTGWTPVPATPSDAPAR